MDTFNALVLSLPTRNSTLRMRVWSGLKETGCGVLRDGVYLLPASAMDATVLGKMESEIRSNGGFAMTLELKAANAGQSVEIRKLFDRSAEYGALVQKIAGAKAALVRLGARRAVFRAAVEELADLDRLR